MSTWHNRMASGSPCGEPEKRGPNSPTAEFSRPSRHDSHQLATTKAGVGHQDRPLGQKLIDRDTEVSMSKQTKPTTVRRYTIEQFMASTWLTGASFSADEQRVLFSSDATGIFNVCSLPATGGWPEALTTSQADTTYAVSYFPDDDRILYTRDNGGDENNHLYVRELDGNERDLTPGDKLKATFLAWRLDGAAFYVLINETDPKCFDLLRYDTDTYARTLLYKNQP